MHVFHEFYKSLKHKLLKLHIVCFYNLKTCIHYLSMIDHIFLLFHWQNYIEWIIFLSKMNNKILINTYHTALIFITNLFSIWNGNILWYNLAHIIQIHVQGHLNHSPQVLFQTGCSFWRPPMKCYRLRPDR